MKHIAYLRVSTAQQAESKAGLNAQLAACRMFAEQNGGNLAATYQDAGVSGAKGLDCRPALLEAIGQLQNGDRLVIAKRDRLGRDPILVAMIEAAIERKGARVVSAAGEGTDGDSPSDILMRRLVDAFSEYERLVIGARTKAALQAKREKMERVGSIPYGYRLASDGKMLVHDQAERTIIQGARDLKKQGLSLRAIAKGLAARGMVNRSGRSFNPKSVRSILQAA